MRLRGCYCLWVVAIAIQFFLPIGCASNSNEHATTYSGPGADTPRTVEQDYGRTADETVRLHEAK